MGKREGSVPVPSPPARASLTINFFTTMVEGVWFLALSMLPRQLFPTSSEETWWSGRKAGSALQAASSTSLALWLHLNKVQLLYVLFWWFISEYENKQGEQLGSLEVHSSPCLTQDLKQNKIFTPSYHYLHQGREVSYGFKGMICKRVVSSCFS